MIVTSSLLIYTELKKDKKAALVWDTKNTKDSAK